MQSADGRPADSGVCCVPGRCGRRRPGTGSVQGGLCQRHGDPPLSRCPHSIPEFPALRSSASLWRRWSSTGHGHRRKGPLPALSSMSSVGSSRTELAKSRTLCGLASTGSGGPVRPSAMRRPTEVESQSSAQVAWSEHRRSEPQAARRPSPWCGRPEATHRSRRR
jgi:hypothetical protein